MLLRKSAVLIALLIFGGCASHGPQADFGAIPSEFNAQPAQGHWLAFKVPGGWPNEMALGSDHNIWFTELADGPPQDKPKIGKITPSGTITEYAFDAPTYPDGPRAITAGATGSLWFTYSAGSPSDSFIGRVTTGGVVTQFPVPAPGCASVLNGNIAYGSDGNIWFGDDCQRTIDRVTPDGNITSFSLAGSSSWGLVSGPDGNLWWIDANGYIGVMSTSGAILKFEKISDPNLPYAIADGPDRKIYVILYGCGGGANSIAQVTTSGKITTYPAPSQYCNQALAQGPDEQMWLVGDVLQKFNPVTHVFSPPIMLPGKFGNDAYSVIEGADKEMWVTHTFENKILVRE
jgi:virginiamycin B lyase